MKIIGFSKDIGSTLSLLPSVMHRLENLLVAIELKDMLSKSFAEGTVVTAERVRHNFIEIELILLYDLVWLNDCFT